MEEWRDIEGYEGLYLIYKNGDNDHCVWSLSRNEWKKSFIWGNGYAYVELSKKHKSKPKAIHILKAKAFIQNPHNCPIINHKDLNKTNNSIENLEWCTYQYNNTYNDRHLDIGIKLLNREDISKQVYQYTLDGELIGIYPSAREAARELGFNHSTIIKCCNGGFFDKNKNKWINITQHKGYRWSYEPL